MGENGNGLVEVGSTPHNPTVLPECKQMFGSIKSDNQKILLALFGADGRDGLVADVAEIKHDKRSINYVGTVVVSMLSSIITAVVTALIIKVMM